jgi:antibiotic biosynthesis monooxygenase (ABM) superfamily enzyme
VLPGREAAYVEWQTRWQSAVLAAPGALSCELWPTSPPDQEETVALVRFESVDALRNWRRSEKHAALVAEARPLVEGGWVMQLAGAAAAEYYVERSATEVIITQIKPGKEAEYRSWFERIQKAQEAFGGYLGSFVQPPHEKETGWTTVLRFDTAENLEAWLNSEERAALLKDSEELVDHVLIQRVDSSFPGWVPNDPVTGKPPAAWKTACLVLLTLFPVVMLELKFLNPRLRMLNPALGTFTGNAISVALTSWPLMPLAIRAFRGWIFPERQPRWIAFTSPIVIVICYAIEIAVLWRLLG